MIIGMKFFGWLLILSLVLSIFLFGYRAFSDRNSNPPRHLREEFDPSLVARIQSVNDLLAYVDSASGMKDRQSLAYAEELSGTIRRRFFHRYAYYSFAKNWAACLTGKLVWKDLASLVIADDILKGTNAACSQQTLVLLACFQRTGVPFRAVRFAHHFASEGMFGGQWYYFDTDKEPQFPNGRKSTAALLKSGEFYTAYNSFSKAETDSWVGEGYPHYDDANVMPAPRARLFQQATKIFSLFIFPLIAVVSLVQMMRLTKRKKTFENTVVVRRKPSVAPPQSNRVPEPTTLFASWRKR